MVGVDLRSIATLDGVRDRLREALDDVDQFAILRAKELELPTDNRQLAGLEAQLERVLREVRQAQQD